MYLSHRPATRAGRAWVSPRGLLLPVLLVGMSLLTACGAGAFGDTTTTGTTTTVQLKVMRGSDGSIFVLAPVLINGHGPYDFALDTGASITLVDTVIANRLRLPVVGQGQTVEGVGGTVTAIPVQVSAWTVGALKLPAATITKGNLPDARRGTGLQGLLGSDVLSRFGKVTIDYANGLLIVYSRVARAPETPPSAVVGALTADIGLPRRAA